MLWQSNSIFDAASIRVLRLLILILLLHTSDAFFRGIDSRARSGFRATDQHSLRMSIFGYNFAWGQPQSTANGSPVVNDDDSFRSEEESMTVLTDDICLVPGDPIVRVEEAPSNARRIFTGIDINCDIDRVWNVLTCYEKLHEVVPSLVKNEVLYRTDHGARLSQVGGAKVLPGVTFTAKTVLDVVTYTETTPIPANMTADHLGNDATDEEVRQFDKLLPLVRGVFPRPYAITRLPCRDITMQNVIGEGDFEHYQGIWRMQPLPNCNPSGGDATRLTYAVEIKPKGLLPVRLIEGRIASDLKLNLKAIRDHAESQLAEVQLAQKLPSLQAQSLLQQTELDISTSLNSPTKKALNALASGVRNALESEIIDLRFENKLLKEKIAFLEDEVMKREKKLNDIRKTLS